MGVCGMIQVPGQGGACAEPVRVDPDRTILLTGPHGRGCTLEPFWKPAVFMASVMKGRRA